MKKIMGNTLSSPLQFSDSSKVFFFIFKLSLYIFVKPWFNLMSHPNFI